MKLTTHEIQSNVESSNLGNETGFKLRASAKAFKILSSGLYSNKIRAIIREVSCNAYDAHLEAENTKPFRVTLPNIDDLNFTVRDYGPGLSEHDMIEVYTTYFESTKSDSNDFTGALGLGSKSPFSYVDQFVVTSFFDGRKKVFTAHYNDRGEPCISKMADVESDEPNGLEVTVTVLTRDVNKFRTEAENTFRWFDTPPDVFGNKDYTPKSRDECFVKQEPTFEWWTDQHKNAPRALQGTVAYPIDLDAIAQADGNALLKRVAKLSPVIRFNIGELDVAPSREALSYDPSTSDIIVDHMECIGNKLENEIDALFNDCPTMWEAGKLLANIKEYSSVKAERCTIEHYQYVVRTGYVPTWNGQEIATTYAIAGVFDQAFPYQPAEKSELKSRNTIVLPKNLESTTYGNPRRSAKDISSGKFACKIKVSDNVAFVIDDLKKARRGLLTRCKQLITDEGYERVVIFQMRVNTYANDADVAKMTCDSSAILDLLGNPPVRYASSIIVPKSLSRRSKSLTSDISRVSTIDVYSLMNKKYRYQQRSNVLSYESRNVDLSKGGFYLNVDGSSKMPIELTSSDSSGEFIWMLSKLKVIKTGDVVVGAGKMALKQIESSTGEWINLIDHMKENFIELFKITDIERQMIQVNLLKKSCAYTALSDYANVTHHDRISSKKPQSYKMPYSRTPLRKLAAVVKYRAGMFDPDKDSRIGMLVRVAKYLFPKEYKIDSTIRRWMEECDARYPMLNYIGSDWNHRANVRHWNDAAEYTKLIEQVRKNVS